MEKGEVPQRIFFCRMEEPYLEEYFGAHQDLKQNTKDKDRKDCPNQKNVGQVDLLE